MRKLKTKKKMNTLDKALIALAIFLFAFILSTIIIYTYKDWQYDTLITMVLSGCGIETVVTGIIQVAKYKLKGDDKNDTGNDIEDN